MKQMTATEALNRRWTRSPTPESDKFLTELIEREFDILARAVFIPALCSPWGRMMP